LGPTPHPGGVRDRRLLPPSGLLMSTLDVSGTALVPGRSPTVRPVGPPSSTRHAPRHTSTATDRSAGRRPCARRAPDRRTAELGGTLDKPELCWSWGAP
jgi:hypothetical protein